MPSSRAHRRRRRYSAAVDNAPAELQGMKIVPDWRQSRQRVSWLPAPGRYPAGVPPCQSAGLLGEHLQPSGLADTGIAGRPCSHGLTARVGECRQASRAIPGFAVRPRSGRICLIRCGTPLRTHTDSATNLYPTS